MSQRQVRLEHVQGTRILGFDGLTVGDLLAANRLPQTLFQAYTTRGRELTPIPLFTPLADVPEGTEVVVRAIRNTLFSTILPNFADLPRTGGALQDGAGFTSIRSDPAGFAVEDRATVTPEQARQMIVDQVCDFSEEHLVGQSGCVFGLSGGGDSNALAYGLKKALPTERLCAFTLVFRDVMPAAAADRASVLCQELGLEHRVFTPESLQDFLGIRTSLDALYQDFESNFGHEALHFFGTFLILKTARRLGREKGFKDLAFGYNREDLLAELLFMLMNGHNPLRYPVRDLGDQRIIMPVWTSPKLLLDACHPRFSIENYRERDDHTTRQRSLAFYLAHTLDSAYPSFGLSLLTGARSTLDGSFADLAYDSEADLFITRQATPELLARVQALIGRHFSAESNGNEEPQSD